MRRHGRAGSARRILTGAGAVGLTALVLAATAGAAGTKVAVGSPLSSQPPSIAVDSSGTALIAWANTRELGGALPFVQYCVLPVGATACTHAGDLQPADGAQGLDGVNVLADGGTLVILADVFGAAGNNAADYEPLQEWQSTDGGATFSIANGGLSVANGIINADSGPLGAVIAPGTNVLGFGWDTAAGPPTFNAFPLGSPPECSKVQCQSSFASLEPAGNPDQISNPFGQFAAQAGAHPGVMGAFDTLFTNGPLACATGSGTAFAYGAGNQSATNSYNLSPGSAGSAWQMPVTQLDCNVQNPAVDGGPSGFGVLETDEGTSTTVYHRFDQAKLNFDTPLVTVAKSAESDPAVAQDGAGGIYATYLLDGAGGPVELAYSATGGSSFTTGELNANTSGRADHVISSVSPAGQGWATWVENGSVFAQSFNATDAVSAAKVASGATGNGKTVTVRASCPSVPCKLSIRLSVRKASRARSAARPAARRRTLGLGKGTFTIRSAGSKKLAVKLSRAGRTFLKSKHGHLRIDAVIDETVQRRRVVIKRTLRLTIRQPKRK